MNHDSMRDVNVDGSRNVQTCGLDSAAKLVTERRFSERGSDLSNTSLVEAVTASVRIAEAHRSIQQHL